MNRLFLPRYRASFLVALAVGCSSASKGIDASLEGGGGATSDVSPIGGDGPAFDAGGSSSKMGSGQAMTKACPPGDASADQDHDGFTVAQGDCNDCEPSINPGAYDSVDYVLDAMGNPTTTPLGAGQQIDQDCDGKATQVGETLACDAGLDFVVGDPFNAAKAMELCNVHVEESPADAKKRTWGVLDAKFSSISGAFLQSPPPGSINLDRALGILPNFGVATKPQAGASMFSLSSGQARAPGQPGFDAGSMCNADSSIESTGALDFPPGFPKAGTCGQTGQPYDGIALDLRVRVPTNAHGMAVQYRFFTCEYPIFTCRIFNDVFAILMDPNPLMSDDKMYPDVAYETSAQGVKNVIGVNNESFLTACTPGQANKGSYSNCTGIADLAGTGFDNNGASAWLVSQVPVTPGSIINLRLAIWDSADAALDSTVVVDNFHWLTDGTPPDVGTSVVTNPH